MMVLPAKALPLQIFSAVRLYTNGQKKARDFWGKEHVAMLGTLRKRMMVLAVLGMSTSKARLIQTGGQGFKLKVEDIAQHKIFTDKAHNLLSRLIQKSGCREVPLDYLDQKGMPLPDHFISTTHQLGSCRMAEGPEEGVVDKEGEVFGYPGMFITDGSVIPTALIVNPSLTILANAERIVKGAISKYAVKT
jgi:cholesterol oxidase